MKIEDIKAFENCFEIGGKLNVEEYSKFRSDEARKSDNNFTYRACKLTKNYLPFTPPDTTATSKTLNWGEESSTISYMSDYYNSNVKPCAISVFEQLCQDGFTIHPKCCGRILKRSDITNEKKRELIDFTLSCGVQLQSNLVMKLFKSGNPDFKDLYVYLKSIDSKKYHGILSTAFIHYGKVALDFLKDCETITCQDVENILKCESLSSFQKIYFLSKADNEVKSLCDEFLGYYLLHIGDGEKKMIDFEFIEILLKLGYDIPKNAWCFFSAKDHTNINVCKWLLDTIDVDTNMIFYSLLTNENDISELKDHPKMIKANEVLKNRILKEQNDRKEYMDMYGETPESTNEREVISMYEFGVCKFFQQNRCHNTPSTHISDTNRFKKNVQGKCAFYHGPIENTYKLTPPPPNYFLNKIESKDGTVNIFLNTETVSSPNDSRLKNFIDSKQIASFLEKQVARLLCESWWLQYTPAFMGKRLERKWLIGGFSHMLSEFHLVKAVCPLTHNSHNLKFRALRKNEIWPRYYSDYETMIKIEGADITYALNNPMD